MVENDYKPDFKVDYKVRSDIEVQKEGVLVEKLKNGATIIVEPIRECYIEKGQQTQ